MAGRAGRSFVGLAALAAVLASSGTASAAVLTPTSDPNQLVAQISGQPGLATGASFTAGSPSSAAAAGVGAAAVGQTIGQHFPTNGETFAALTTGSVLSADPPNEFTDAGTDNETAGGGAYDVTSFRVELNVPAEHNCLTLDTAFYSEEFPEFVDSQFNDFFLATLDDHSWSYDEATNTVAAPGNFAFDRDLSQLTINTAFVDPGDTQLEYDGGTEPLWARTPVTPGAHSLVFTIADAGDHAWDSAAFIDNLRTSNVPPDQCKAGAIVAGSLDHDCEQGGKYGKPYEITAGPLAAVGCWRKQGDKVVARQPVRVNGIDLKPRKGSTEISIDTRSYVIRWNGLVFPWVGHLPLPPLPPHLHWRARTPTVLAYNHKPKKPDPNDPADQFSTKKRTMFGLPVEGGVELKLDGGKTSLKLNVTMPELKNPLLKRLAGFTGEMTVSATNEDGLVIDGAELKLPSFGIKWIEVTDALVKASRTAAGNYHFDGGLTVYPFKSLVGPGFIGDFGWGPSDDYFKLGLGAENINRHLAYGVFLQKLFGALQVNPFGITGATAATFGPQIRIPGVGLIRAARVDGSFSYVDAYDSDGDGRKEPRVFKITGASEIVMAKASEAEVKVSGGKVDVTAKNTQYKAGDYGLEGTMTGWFTTKAFNLEGLVDLSLPVAPDANGEAVISNSGIGACAHLPLAPDVGWGYRWGDLLPSVSLWGCNLGAWRAAEGGSRLVADGSGERPVPTSIVVKKKTSRLALRASGAGGVPAVSFVAPDGTRYTPGAQPTSSETVLAFSDPAASAAYLAVENPHPGRWQVEVAPGSVPLSSLARGVALPKMRIKASVTGRGAQRILRYRLRHRAGRRVVFVETGGAARRVIGRAKGAAGELRFRPSYGAGGKRRIVALVSRRGVPAPSRTAAKYKTKAVRPARPAGLQVKQLGRYRRVITWRGPRSFSYDVVVRTTDGRKLRYLRPGSKKRVIVRMVPEKTRLRVRVNAISAEGVEGPSARGRG